MRCRHCLGEHVKTCEHAQTLIMHATFSLSQNCCSCFRFLSLEHAWNFTVDLFLCVVLIVNNTSSFFCVKYFIVFTEFQLLGIPVGALSRLSLPLSSLHLSTDLRRAFMKKFATVVTSRPSCWAIVACISFEGLLVSLNIACRVLL